MDRGYYDIKDKSAVIRRFQEMLSYVMEEGAGGSGIAPIIPSGTYDEATAEAVRAYQASSGLHVTGLINAETWDAVAGDYGRLSAEMSRPRSISPFPYIKGYKIKKGEVSRLVMMLQIMLGELAVIYDELGGVPVTGVYDERTAEGVRRFRYRNFLPDGDYVDRTAWDAIARQYDMHVNESE
ncbi:MAG: peptidoglycan-binding protein [Firmicutes bacterium]|nr:peptidoglycan-binding protein [Bacillota bacterium]